MKMKKQILAFALLALLASSALAGPVSHALKKERWYYTEKVHGSMKTQGRAAHRADLEMQKVLSETPEDWKFRIDMTRDLNSDKTEIAGALITKDYGKTGLIETVIHKENGDLIREVITIPPSRFTPRQSHLNFHHDPDEILVITRNNHGRLEERLPLEDEMLEMTVKEVKGTKYRATKTWELKKTENGTKSHVIAEVTPRSGNQGQELIIEGRPTEPKVVRLTLFKNPKEHAIHFTMEGDVIKVYIVKEDPVPRVTEETFVVSQGTLLAEKQRKVRYLSDGELIKMGLLVDSTPLMKTQVKETTNAARGMKIEASK